jgi:uncharacterized protein YceK
MIQGDVIGYFNKNPGADKLQIVRYAGSSIPLTGCTTVSLGHASRFGIGTYAPTIDCPWRSQRGECHALVMLALPFYHLDSAIFLSTTMAPLFSPILVDLAFSTG